MGAPPQGSSNVTKLHEYCRGQELRAADAKRRHPAPPSASQTDFGRYLVLSPKISCRRRQRKRHNTTRRQTTTTTTTTDDNYNDNRRRHETTTTTTTANDFDQRPHLSNVGGHTPTSRKKVVEEFRQGEVVRGVGKVGGRSL